MNPFSALGDESIDQVRKYLRFFRQKREGIVRTVAREFEDAKSDRIHEDVYSREDMEEFAEYLKSSLTTLLSAELTNVINMGALSVSQLLENAQEKGISINLETSAVENQQLLEAVEKMSLDAIPKTQAKKLGQLTSLKEETKAMKESIEQLEEDNRRLQEDLSFYKNRLAASERQEAMSQRIASEGKQRDEDSSRDRIRDLESQLTEAREENEKRVSDTIQFQQMKKLMQSQATNLSDLRRRLARYEPDDAKGE